MRDNSIWAMAIEFSEKTFGPGMRTEGVTAHIRKELAEIEAEPNSLEEWIDVMILAFDGAWRCAVYGHGCRPGSAAATAVFVALRDKYAKNFARKWPDWRTAPKDQPIEHVRDEPARCHHLASGPAADPDIFYEDPCKTCGQYVVDDND